MDALAAAADAAAAAAVEEELLQQQENMRAQANLKCFFDDKGVGRIIENGDIKLVQLKTACSALHCCKFKDAPLSALLRCDLCGYSSHSSCQKSLSPTLPELVKNRVCNICIQALELPTSPDNSRCVNAYGNEKAMHYVSLELRKRGLDLLPKKSWAALKDQFDDGLFDVMDDDDDDEEEVDDMEDDGANEEEEEEGEFESKMLRY
jgi:hypothetical protein